MSHEDALAIGEDILVLRQLKRRIQDDLDREENILRRYLEEQKKRSFDVGDKRLKLVTSKPKGCSPSARRAARRYSPSYFTLEDRNG